MSEAKKRRVLVTGMGIVSAAGDSVSAFLESLREGVSCISRIEGFNTEGLRNGYGGEVKTVPPKNSQGRSEIFARLAARQAVEDASLRAPLPLQSGVVASTHFGGLRCGEGAFFADISARSPIDPADFEGYSFSQPAHMLAAELGIGGPVATVSLSCVSGCSALGVAFDWIRQGRVSKVVVVGFDALSFTVLAGLGALQVITEERIRPFAANRSGTLLGEGAAAIVLESEESAAERDVELLAEVKGYGVNNNAYHFTERDGEAETIAVAMQMALDQAEISPDEVDFISAHGSGSKQGDLNETQAIKTVLGPKAYETPIHSIKPIIGDLMGGMGIAEAIACVLSMKEGILFPTINYDKSDPKCDLDYVPNECREAAIKIALKNCSSIGGCNASIVLASNETQTGT